MDQRGRSRAGTGVWVVALILAAPLTARAATFTVNSTADAVDVSPGDGVCATADGSCTLRAAIQEANALAGADTVVLPAGTYLLTLAGAGEDGAATGDLDITGDLIIAGAGAASTVVDGNGLDRVFHVDPAAAGIAVSMSGLTIRNGKTVLISFVDASGGGILLGAPNTAGSPAPAGTLTLTDCVVQANATPRGGGGIANKAGKLRLVRTMVAGNVAAAGGGIANGDLGTLSLVDSTVRDNVAANGDGGGIGSGLFDNSVTGTQVSLIGSTVSGNRATGQGGGAGIHRGIFTARNSTFSGNTAFGGGGIGVDGFGTSARVESCTIANNHAGVANSGGGAGGVGGALSLTLANTLIAGNTTEVVSPDCGGTLTSAGHNLVQNPSGCALTAAPGATGDRMGADPLLAPLGDNGGPTLTHALQAGSPAIDAADPGLPGSGSGACPASDQRGILRPRGAACDIGALEVLGGFRVLGIVPERAGNQGTLLTLISGSGLVPGASIALVRAGQADIPAQEISVAGDSVASASFDVSGKAPGSWDVVVTNPDGSSARQGSALALEASRGPRIWHQLLGPTIGRPGMSSRFLLVVRNDGNVDALAVPVGIAVVGNASAALGLDLAPPPAQTGQVPFDWRVGHLEVDSTPGASNKPLLLSSLPAGSTRVIELDVPISGAAASGSTVTVQVGVGDPMVDAALDPSPAAIDEEAAGATAHVQRAFALAVPDAAVPALRAYIGNQLRSLAASGRGAVIAGYGSAPAHSLVQLEQDAALYALSLALAPPPARATAPSSSIQALGGGVVPTPGGCNLIIPRGGICPAGCSCSNPGPGFPNPAIPPECQNPADAAAGKCRPSPPLCEWMPNMHFSSGSNSCEPCKPDSKGSCEPPWIVRVLLSRDPNEKTGAAGIGAARYVAPGQRLAWSVQFENARAATAPAQQVFVTDQLDGSVIDLDTLALGPIAFGRSVIAPQAGAQAYAALFDLRPAQNLIVRVEAALDRGSGTLSYRLLSLDPATLQLTADPLLGLLPPDATPPEGEGAVAFTALPRPGLPTGTKICNTATIVFDTNAPIDTPAFCNTIDATKPTSSVAALPAQQTETTFTVRWSGSDEGSGVADYTIQVSEDGGPYGTWLSHTADLSAPFTGQIGKTYAFYSIAIDGVGNVQDAPSTPDTTTQIIAPPDAGTAGQAPPPAKQGCGCGHADSSSFLLAMLTLALLKGLRRARRRGEAALSDPS